MLHLIVQITSEGFPDGCLLKMPDDATVEEIKRLVAAELHADDYHNVQLFYQGNELVDDSLLVADFGVVDEEILQCNINETPKTLDHVVDLGAPQNVHTKPNWSAIEKAYAMGVENSPGDYLPPLMLYIDIEINQQKIKAFVDTGAERTIISQACAERCALSQLINPLFSGSATGVGEATIVGRVHYVDILIEDKYYGASLSVLQEEDAKKNAEVLIGLDFLKKHKCTVSMRSSSLIIESTSSAVPFLTEDELPEHAQVSGKLIPMTLQ